MEDRGEGRGCGLPNADRKRLVVGPTTDTPDLKVPITPCSTPNPLLDVVEHVIEWVIVGYAGAHGYLTEILSDIFCSSLFELEDSERQSSCFFPVVFTIKVITGRIERLSVCIHSEHYILALSLFELRVDNTRARRDPSPPVIPIRFVASPDRAPPL